MNGAYAPPPRAPASLRGGRDTGRQQESCRSAALLGLCGRAASAPGDCRIKFVV